MSCRYSTWADAVLLKPLIKFTLYHDAEIYLFVNVISKKRISCNLPVNWSSSKSDVLMHTIFRVYSKLIRKSTNMTALVLNFI